MYIPKALLKFSNTGIVRSNNIMDRFKIYLITGKVTTVGPGYMVKNRSGIEDLIRIGGITKIVKVTSDGTEETIFP
jgi:hypothetical protein